MKRIISLFVALTLLISALGVLPVQAEHKRMPFTDLEYVHHTGYLNVKNLYDRGIINGKSATKFAPDDVLTREEVAKIIVLATEKKLVDKKGTFSDVKGGSWYEPYVETAVANDIVKGIGDGQFGVGKTISRQDAVVLIGRMADAMGIELERITQTDITDKADIADYAKDYVTTLIEMNAVDLKGTNFLPKVAITRLDFCIYLDRVLISDVRAYDDIYQKWIPVEKPVEEMDSVTFAFEDFEDDVMSFVGTVPDLKSDDGTTRIVKDMGKDSKCSLKVTAKEAANLYIYGIKPGTTYYVAYDIKVEGLDKSDTLARVNYVWGTPTGRIGGGYKVQNDLKGTVDWKRQMHEVTSPTPDLSPEYLRLYFSVRGDTEGAAWFDNLEIYEVVYEPVTTYLKLPAYKGLITDPDGEGDIRLTSYVTGVGSMYAPETTKLVNSISDLKGNVLMQEEVFAPGQEMDISFSSKNLAIGDYDLCSKLVDTKEGKVLGENHYMIRKRASDFKTRYRFDEEGRFLRNGEPWFPFGAYALGNNPSDLNDFTGTNIDFIISNSVASFWQNYDLLDKWADAGLHLMLTTDNIFKNSLRGQYQNVDVTTIASERAILERMVADLDLPNKKAFLGYQINNESSPLQWGSRMGWRNQYLSEFDFDHINYGVSGGGEGVYPANARMQDVYACDEPYPISGKADDPIWEVWEKSKAVADEALNRPIWTVLQVSDLKLMGREPYLSRERGPNEQELRNMAWQAVCAGAQGIIYYAHFHVTREDAGRPKSETFAEYLRVTDEVHAFQDVILSREDTPDLYPRADRMDRFAYGVRRYQGKTYVFLANSAKESQTVSVKLDNVVSADGVYAKKRFEVADDGYIDVKLEPLGVEVLVIDQSEPKSADCQLKNVQFASGDDSLFVSVVKDADDVLRLANGAEEISYNIAMHKDAKLRVNGDAVTSTSGTVSIKGANKITFTITSEDGKHKQDYVYNIVRN